MSEHLKMLLIDDDELLVESTGVLVGRRFAEKVALTGMSDSVAAKRWIDAHAPDLVLTDLQMPAVDGFEILRAARKRNPYCQVIIQSGHFSASALSLALRLEASDYVQKSSGYEDVLEAVACAYRRVVRWKQALSTSMACSREA